jgi:hypothetical protein
MEIARSVTFINPFKTLFIALLLIIDYIMYYTMYYIFCPEKNKKPPCGGYLNNTPITGNCVSRFQSPRAMKPRIKKITPTIHWSYFSQIRLSKEFCHLLP